jgi:hypothetical protein
MPRILNPALGTFVSGQDIGANPKNRNFRITHQEDAVSDMVPQTFTDEETGKTTFWRHVIPSYLITTDDIDIPTANDIDVVPTDEDVPVDGIGALLNLGTIIDAHRMYFNQISACGPEIIVEPPTFAQYEDVLGFGNSPFGK